MDVGSKRQTIAARAFHGSATWGGGVYLAEFLESIKSFPLMVPPSLVSPMVSCPVNASTVPRLTNGSSDAVSAWTTGARPKGFSIYDAPTCSGAARGSYV